MSYAEVDGPERTSRGCFFYGCLTVVVLSVLAILVAGFAAYRFWTGQIKQFTADAPIELPVVDFTPEELAEIEGRIETFKTAIEQEGPTEELVLTADEINTLIMKEEDLRGRAFIRIAEGEISADVSIPTDGLPGGRGRFFNASATLDVSMEDGVLIVTLADAMVDGTPIPAVVSEALKGENLAQDLYKDAETAELLRRIESFSLEDDRVVLRVRPAPKAASATEEDAPIELQPEEESLPDEPPQDEAVEVPATSEVAPASPDGQ